MKKTQKDLEHLALALDEEDAQEDAQTPIDPEEANRTVAALGVDVPALAAKLRGVVTDAAARERAKRFAAASLAYADELARFEEKKHAAPPPPRDLQLARMKQLLGRVPREPLALHFHKYESATDEELAELVRALEHLLAGRDDDG